MSWAFAHHRARKRRKGFVGTTLVAARERAQGPCRGYAAPFLRVRLRATLSWLRACDTMSPNQWIALTSIVVTSGTAFLIGYWHRKQMRQIEEFRRDPSAGLRLPPSRLWVLVKSYGPPLGLFGCPAYLLVAALVQKGPITRWTVFQVAYSIAAIMFGIILLLLMRIQEVFDLHFELFDRHSELAEKHISITKAIVETTAQAVNAALAGTP